MIRKWFICGFAVCAVAFVSAASAGTYRPDEVPNVQLRDRNRYVSNPDGILSEGAVSRIDEVCAALRAKGLAQVAVVAVDDIESGDAFRLPSNCSGVGVSEMPATIMVWAFCWSRIGMKYASLPAVDWRAFCPMRSANGFRCSSCCRPFGRTISIAA